MNKTKQAKLKGLKYDVPVHGFVREYTSPTGVKTHLYDISSVSYNLSRQTSTLHRWEKAGIIPKTPFRISNKRAYCTEMIDLLKECIDEENLPKGHISLQSTGFSEKIYAGFAEIYKKLFGEKGVEE